MGLGATRLGPYEITAQIGEGGMGEVYRATDTHLKRAVAIKVLPASVAGDSDRLARFQRDHRTEGLNYFSYDVSADARPSCCRGNRCQAAPSTCVRR